MGCGIRIRGLVHPVCCGRSLCGYLPTTILFAVLLVLRAGYRSFAAVGSAVIGAVVIVVLFKTLLQVKLPAGRIYEALPDGLRQIMLTYF